MEKVIERVGEIGIEESLRDNVREIVRGTVRE